MRCVAVVFLGTWLFSQVAPAAEPATAPATAPATKPVRVRPPVVGAAVPNADPSKAQREQEQRRISAIQVGGKYKLPEVLQCSIKDGLLQVNWVGPDMTTPTRVEVEGSPVAWVINRAGVLPNAVAGQFILSVQRFEFDRPGTSGPWMETLSAGPTYVNLSAMFAPGAGAYSVSFYQMTNGTIRLSATSYENGVHRQVLMATAGTIAQLQADHPEEVRKYLAPLLRDFSGVDWLRPGPADVYRVFDQIGPDMKVAQKLTDILGRLDSEIFTEREAASRDLTALGRPGVLAALRHDPAALTPEQKSRLAGFVSLHSRRTIDNPAQSRREVSFILESLEDEDPAVRAAAREALETTTGRKIAIDISLPADKLGAAVDALRAELARPATQPTTNPTGEAGGRILAPVN